MSYVENGAYLGDWRLDYQSASWQDKSSKPGLDPEMHYSDSCYY